MPSLFSHAKGKSGRRRTKPPGIRHIEITGRTFSLIAGMEGTVIKIKNGEVDPIEDIKIVYDV